MGLPPMWVCAALAIVAVVVTQLVLQMQQKSTQLPDEKNKERQQEPVVSVLQKDETRERQAEASEQLYPVGALVNTKVHGTAKVLAFDAETKTYEVEISIKEEGEAAKTLKLREQEIEVTEVAAFYMYPIKSCAGTRLDSANITCTGYCCCSCLEYCDVWYVYRHIHI